MAFEQSFAGSALAALARDRRIPYELKHCLRQFSADEAKHCRMWRMLNRLCAPQWYESKERHIIRIAPTMLRTLRLIAGHPRLFPMVLWLMLALEEHSMEISRRCARVPKEQIEPTRSWRQGALPSCPGGFTVFSFLRKNE